jgi:hypothetical protein
MLGSCATILLVASALLGAEAGIMIILGPDRNIVVRPFLLLGYLEVCAIFFSIIGIVCSIVGLIFYRPYLYLCEKLLKIRARRAGEDNSQYTFYQNIPSPVRARHQDDEDGSPD